MKTGRNLIISAVLALGAAGTIFASVATPAVTAAAAPAAHVTTVASVPNTFYRG